MKKSALQTARASYQPKLPEAIKNGVTIVEGKATQSVADQEAIAKLFPNTYGMPVLRFEAAAKKEYPAINVGVILSGGQAPGGHNVISGLFDGLKALNKESRLFGFLLGPGGLIEHKYMELTADIIDDYRNTGGFRLIRRRSGSCGATHDLPADGKHHRADQHQVDNHIQFARFENAQCCFTSVHSVASSTERSPYQDRPSSSQPIRPPWQRTGGNCRNTECRRTDS